VELAWLGEDVRRRRRREDNGLPPHNRHLSAAVEPCVNDNVRPCLGRLLTPVLEDIEGMSKCLDVM
jgi:hypothetical protein